MNSGNSAGSPANLPGPVEPEKDSVIFKRLIYNFFAKATSILINARVTSLESASHDESKINNWFNLSTDISNLPKDQLLPWKTQDISSIPPLIIETYLDLRDTYPKQKVYLNDKENNPWFVTRGRKKTEIVLERWLFELSQTAAPEDLEESDSESPEEPLKSIYKKCIILFRDLFTYVNLLPATELKKAINSSETSEDDSRVYQNLKVGVRILSGNQPISSKGRIGLSKELISTYTNISNESDDIRPHLSDEKFKSISTPYGYLKISVQYRKDANFYLSRKITEATITDEYPSASGSANAAGATAADLDGKQAKRLSSLSNQSYSPPSEFPHTQSTEQQLQLKNPSEGPSSTDTQNKIVSSTSEKPQVAKAIPIIDRSNSNVSLAALLRNAKNNQTNTSYNIGSYNTGMSIPKSFTSSYAGSLVLNNYIPSNAISISPNNHNNPQQQYAADHQVGSMGSQPRYSSSFSSRHQLQGQRKSLLLASNSQSNHSISRNPSLESRRYSDLEPPSQLFVDDDINDFIKLVDNKKDLRVGNAGTNLNDSLFRFKSMRTSTNVLGDSFTDNAVFNTNSPPIDTRHTAPQRGRLGSLPPSSNSIGSNHSIFMNRTGSYNNSNNTNIINNHSLAKKVGGSPLAASLHRYSLSSNSPHSHTDRIHTLPSRLSGTSPPADYSKTQENAAGVFPHNASNTSSYSNHREDHNGSNLYGYNEQHSGSSRGLSITHSPSPSPPHTHSGLAPTGVNIPSEYYRSVSQSRGNQVGANYGIPNHGAYHYDVGSAPLPIIDNRLMSNHSNPFLPQQNAYSYSNNVSGNEAGKYSKSPVFNNTDNKLIANRYKPQRHVSDETASGLNLHSFVSRPSIAITTTTNAYAKMNDFGPVRGRQEVSSSPVPPNQGDDCNFDTAEGLDDDDCPNPEEDDMIFSDG